MREFFLLFLSLLLRVFGIFHLTSQSSIKRIRDFLVLSRSLVKKIEDPSCLHPSQSTHKTGIFPPFPVNMMEKMTTRECLFDFRWTDRYCRALVDQQTNQGAYIPLPPKQKKWNRGDGRNRARNHRPGHPSRRGIEELNLPQQLNQVLPDLGGYSSSWRTRSCYISNLP